MDDKMYQYRIKNLDTGMYLKHGNIYASIEEDRLEFTSDKSEAAEWSCPEYAMFHLSDCIIVDIGNLLHYDFTGYTRKNFVQDRAKVLQNLCDQKLALVKEDKVIPIDMKHDVFKDVIDDTLQWIDADGDLTAFCDYIIHDLHLALLRDVYSKEYDTSFVYYYEKNEYDCGSRAISEDDFVIKTLASKRGTYKVNVKDKVEKWFSLFPSTLVELLRS